MVKNCMKITKSAFLPNNITRGVKPMFEVMGTPSTPFVIRGNPGLQNSLIKHSKFSEKSVVIT